MIVLFFIDQNDNSKLKIDQTPIQPKLWNFDYIDMSKVHGNLEIIFEDKGKNESDFVYQHELFKHLNQQRKDEIRQSSKTIGNSHQEGDSITSEGKLTLFLLSYRQNNWFSSSSSKSSSWRGWYWFVSKDSGHEIQWNKRISI